VNDPNAELSVRDWPGGERTAIPREQWAFAHDEHGAPVPDPNHIWLEGGFDAGKVYEVVYTTNTCPVVGTGLLAMRECTAFLHHASEADGNPCAGRIERTYSYGRSQSGRFIRHFLYHGLNRTRRDARCLMACCHRSRADGAASSTTASPSRRTSPPRASGT
jgi:hypothetical protein